MSPAALACSRNSAPSRRSAARPLATLRSSVPNVVPSVFAYAASGPTGNGLPPETWSVSATPSHSRAERLEVRGRGEAGHRRDALGVRRDVERHRLVGALGLQVLVAIGLELVRPERDRRPVGHVAAAEAERPPQRAGEERGVVRVDRPRPRSSGRRGPGGRVGELEARDLGHGVERRVALRHLHGERPARHLVDGERARRLLRRRRVLAATRRGRARRRSPRRARPPPRSGRPGCAARPAPSARGAPWAPSAASLLRLGRLRSPRLSASGITVAPSAPGCSRVGFGAAGAGCSLDSSLRLRRRLRDRLGLGAARGSGTRARAPAPARGGSAAGGASPAGGRGGGGAT